MSRSLYSSLMEDRSLQIQKNHNLIYKAIGDGSDAQLIRIFTICYTNNNYNPSGAVQLRYLSEGTGGTAFIATNADELAD